jgi:hypothetical protein
MAAGEKYMRPDFGHVNPCREALWEAMALCPIAANGDCCLLQIAPKVNLHNSDGNELIQLERNFELNSAPANPHYSSKLLGLLQRKITQNNERYSGILGQEYDWRREHSF